MTHLKPDRRCCVCDYKLFGRSDKRFCSLKCKNKYHSDIRKKTTPYAKDALKLIQNNHRILNELFTQNCQKVTIEALVLKRKGFQFNAVNAVEFLNDVLTFHVLNFSFQVLSNQLVEIVKTSHEIPISPYVLKRVDRFGPFST